MKGKEAEVVDMDGVARRGASPAMPGVGVPVVMMRQEVAEGRPGQQ